MPLTEGMPKSIRRGCKGRVGAILFATIRYAVL